jgi:GT2 family glycosyltransferase
VFNEDVHTGIGRLAVIVVSANSAHWLRPCLHTVFERAGGIELDVVVVASGCTDDTVALVEREFPRARTLSCENRGFAHGNNQALRGIDADWVLFLNPDTEILEGTLAELVACVAPREDIGLVGVRQITPDGSLFPTIRRFPSVTRALFEALGSERFPFRASWLGERELDLDRYEEEVECDWTSGSFMLARRDALLAAGLFDERFFLYAEETDLCLRIKRAGWRILHLPYVTVLHHGGGLVSEPRLHAQAAFARRQYLAKNLPPARRVAALGALTLGYGIRALAPDGATGRRRSATVALKTVLGLEPPPFGQPPRVSLVRDERADDG